MMPVLQKTQLALKKTESPYITIYSKSVNFCSNIEKGLG
jgi:hypothetical protein